MTASLRFPRRYSLSTNFAQSSTIQRTGMSANSGCGGFFRAQPPCRAPRQWQRRRRRSAPNGRGRLGEEIEQLTGRPAAVIFSRLYSQWPPVREYSALLNLWASLRNAAAIALPYRGQFPRSSFRRRAAARYSGRRVFPILGGGAACPDRLGVRPLKYIGAPPFQSLAPENPAAHNTHPS
jgi:hypothetical protein